MAIVFRMSKKINHNGTKHTTKNQKQRQALLAARYRSVRSE
ncbi:hypothetical protein PLANPX_5955 [Lacipirellula parvula]|uniref:Uncharacterized protein n=1 Tax=Lacipirellula parvula TaxID=2650471 RepID=A0A5K7XNE0_9BACT|nr:hypothetical protein PLANPX_5955 [Lacipirellula parvula]